MEYLDRHFIIKKNADWIQRPGFIGAFVILSFISARYSGALLLYTYLNAMINHRKLKTYSKRSLLVSHCTQYYCAFTRSLKIFKLFAQVYNIIINNEY